MDLKFYFNNKKSYMKIENVSRLLVDERQYNPFENTNWSNILQYHDWIIETYKRHCKDRLFVSDNDFSLVVNYSDIAHKIYITGSGLVSSVQYFLDGKLTVVYTRQLVEITNKFGKKTYVNNECN
jgi:hypothetical protein